MYLYAYFPLSCPSIEFAEAALEYYKRLLWVPEAVLTLGIVIAGGVTVYALGDMILYNRRKKHEWMLDQKAQFKHALESAHTALSTGTATEEQLAFLQREEEHVLQVRQAEAAKKKPGIFKKSKEWLFSGLKKEEEGDDVGSSERRLGYEALSEEDDAMGERESDILRAIEERRLELKEKAKNAFEVEKERQRTGGMLDRLGTKNESLSTSKEEEPKARGWTSFMTRR